MSTQFMLLIFILYPFSVETEDSTTNDIYKYANKTRFNVWGMYYLV